MVAVRNRGTRLAARCGVCHQAKLLRNSISILLLCVSMPLLEAISIESNVHHGEIDLDAR